MKEPFFLHNPLASFAPMVIDSPHSGTYYPPDFSFACPLSWLQQTEDRFVDMLFAAAPQQGIALLGAQIARAYIDLNRAEDDVLPDMLADVPGYRLNPTERSCAGYGLIRHICRGQPVYEKKLESAALEQRLQQVYRPYHTALKNIMDQRMQQCGQVWHINAHSMPADTAPKVDIVLGDRDGTACEAAYSHFIATTLRGMGYRVALNAPFKGVEIVRRCGHPQRGRHSVQLEVSRALYMNEETLAPHSGFAGVQADMTKLLERLAEWTRARSAEARLAAE